MTDERAIEIRKVDLGHINLRGNAGNSEFAEAVADVLGQDLPVRANKISRSEHRVYWLGPDEWHIVTALEEVASIIAQLEQKLAGQHAATNDLSGGQIALHLSGPDVPSLLAKGCTLDLHASVFLEGDCAQSLLGKAPVLFGYIDVAPDYEIIVRRSFSEYLQAWLSHYTHSPVASASF